MPSSCHLSLTSDYHWQIYPS
ncbi:hypothetical protein EMIT0158MI4_90132 [Burkholderia ambifaria]